MLIRVFSLVLSIAFAGSVASQDFSRLIERGKYSKTYKKANKTISKNPQSVEANYFLAVVKSKEASKNLYDPKEAYVLMNTAQALYGDIFEIKLLNKLDKIPINITAFRSLTDTVCRTALSDAQKANTLQGYLDYLNFYKKAPEEYKIKAIVQRNHLAFQNAKAIHTILAYQKFIDTYPNSQEAGEANRQIHIIAFRDASKENTVESYQYFINIYPEAAQNEMAIIKRDEVAYLNAIEINTSESFKLFCEKYPKSIQYNLAYEFYENTLYKEEIIEGDWQSYISFSENFPNNRNFDDALLKAYEIGVNDLNISALLSCLEKDFEGVNRDVQIKYVYNLITQDGELNTLENFKNEWPQFMSYISSYQNDLYYAKIADKFLLHLPYDRANYSKYYDYLSNVKNKDMSFVIAQRIVSPFIQAKRYKRALNELAKLPLDKSSKQYEKLKEILSNPQDLSIKPSALYSLNSKGNEFSPIPTADENKIYFCGQNRTDNLGGEDIYEALKVNGKYRNVSNTNGLSTARGNEAPLSISTDGTQMLLFKSGKIFFANKTNIGWTIPQEWSFEINSGEWQGDAMISSDGKNVLFSAVRKGETFNLNKLSYDNYHGDLLYPTDLFVSSIDKYGNWSYPMNLGKSINTRYCERFPFLHPDMKTMYFSSDGHGGLGKLDVYMTTRLSDSCWNCWAEPINLGKEINTAENDAGYKISTSGDKAYFTLNKRKVQESSVLFLLDVSGSMSGDKLSELKKVSKSTCKDVINNNAEVSIAAFDGDCNNPINYYLPFTKDYDQIEGFIDGLVASGGTPMYEAYYRASHLLKNDASSRIKNKVLVLMTDGDAGSCSPLKDVLNKLKKGGKLFKTQTIAYGVSEYSQAYKDLELISSFSRGDIYHAASTKDLDAAFEKANSNIYKIVSGPDNKDLYSLRLPNHLRPDFVAKISGKLTDSNKNPISTVIKWENLETNEIIGSAKTDPKDGSYFIVLPMGKNYGYFIQDSIFFPLSQSLDLRNTKKAITIEKDIIAISYDEMIKNGNAVKINNLFFDFGKSDLLSASIPELKRMAKLIKDYSLKVELSGHTDNIGKDKENQILSEARANSAREFLITIGCNPEKLISVGYGSTKPVATNDTNAKRQLNRRVELRFINN